VGLDNQRFEKAPHKYTTAIISPIAKATIDFVSDLAQVVILAPEHHVIFWQDSTGRHG
jgi:hypothetical protein